MDAEPRYIVVLQCDIARQRCSGFHCENSFFKREGSFECYANQEARLLTITCGGCCGQGTLRQLSTLFRLLRKQSDIKPDQVVLHFASCVAFESFHGPVCPHLDYLKQIVERKGLRWKVGSRISDLSARRRDGAGNWDRSRAEHPPRKKRR